MEGHLPEGSYFVDWESFDHPQLGMLEIGAPCRCWLTRCLRRLRSLCFVDCIVDTVVP